MSFTVLRGPPPEGTTGAVGLKRSILVAGATPGPQGTLHDLLRQPDMLVQHCKTPGQCLAELERHLCGLLIVYLVDEPDSGCELIVQVKSTYPAMPILALVGPGDVSVAIRAMKAGAADCLEISAQAAELRAAISDLLRRRCTDSRSNDLGLTRTESLVLAHILEGRTTLAVAQILHRSHRTIEVHRRTIMRKLRVSSIVDLLKRAISLGLMPANPPQAQDEDTRIAEA